LLVVVIFWILIDPKFSDTVELGMIDLRLRPHPGLKQSIMDEIHAEWRGRLWLLAALSSLAIMSSMLMLGRLFVGTSGGRSIAAILTATAVVAGWLCLFTQFDRFRDYSIVWRIKKQIPELKSLAQRLNADWPVETVDIPPYGTFQGDEEHPHLLMTPDYEPPPFTEKLGHFVYRQGDTILFEFRPDYDSPFYVEFHQVATAPESFTEEFPEFINRYELDSFEVVDDGIYLSRYRNLTEFRDPELEELLSE
jgi:hypothetical protein